MMRGKVGGARMGRRDKQREDAQTADVKTRAEILLKAVESSKWYAHDLSESRKERDSDLCDRALLQFTMYRLSFQEDTIEVWCSD